MGLKVDIDVSDITQTLESLIDDTTMTQVHQAFAETIDPWVPKITGRLSESGLSNCDADGVHYKVDYANQEYYAHHIHRTDQHPLASSQWDKVAMESELDSFKVKVKDIIVDRCKSLNG